MKPCAHLATTALLMLTVWWPLAVAAAEQTTPHTAATLEQIATYVQSAPLQQGRFEQRKYLHILPKPLLSKGYFLFQGSEPPATTDQPSPRAPQRQLIWQVEAPLSSRLTFSEQGILQQQNGQQQWLVRGDQPGVATIGDLMTALLTNDWEHLQRYFAIQVLPESQLSHWQLQLTPRDAPLVDMIERIEMAGDDQVRHITLWEAGDNRTEIDFQPHPSNRP